MKITPDILDALWRQRLMSKSLQTIMASNAELAWCFAHHVLRGPFPAGEAVMAEEAETAYDYARFCLFGPFPAGEAAIAKSPRFSYKYAKWILDAAFPAGEAAIATNADYAAGYAEVLYQRFPLGEPEIMTDSSRAGHYAVSIMKAPWPEAEPYIARKNTASLEYMKFLCGDYAGEKFPGAAERFKQIREQELQKDEIVF